MPGFGGELPVAVVRDDVEAARERSRGALPVDWLGWLACAAAVVGFALVLVGWAVGPIGFSVPWAPALDLRLSFTLDGLGALYALLATGVGALVFGYGTRYLSVHLAHEGRPAAERWRFWPWMALFAVAMVGLATAQDMVLLFVFFDLTAVCSYFLIGFDRDRLEARVAALMALLVTVIGAVAMLVAAVLLYATYGTFSIPELIARAGPGPVTTAAAALLAVSALAKSAQVPLHFWLPRAMAAPTPVSAYLHSAAMVAAGVLVLGRVHPLLARSPAVLTGLLVVGTLSIVVGGVLALRQDVLKQVLAYSTISQYGYVVVMYAIGGAAGNGAAAFYVLAHGVAKSALFMTAGACTLATGEDRLSRLGGLARRMPVLAVAAGVAAATLAALPLTIGFFKDELLFTAALTAGPPAVVLAVVAAALTFAYIARFWILLFLGPQRAEVGEASGVLVAPVVVLAVVAVLGGLVATPFARLAAAAGTVSHGAPVTLDPAYHLDARAENLLALAAWALGGLLLVARRPVGWVSRGLAAAGERLGPRRIYEVGLHALGARLRCGARPRGARPAHQRRGRARPGRGADRTGLLGHPDGGRVHAGPGGRYRLAGAGAARARGRRGRGDRAGAGPADGGARALGGRVRAGGGVRAARRAGCRTGRGRRRDHAHAGVPRGAGPAARRGTRPRPRCDGPRAEAAPRPRGRRGRGARRVRRGVGLPVPACRGHRVVGPHPPHSDRARRRRGHRDRRRFPRPGHAGRDHGAARRRGRGVRTVGTGEAVVSRRDRSRMPDAVVRVVARMLLGPVLMVAAALIAKGYAEVGDGFGAGVAVSLVIALAYVALGGAGAEAALPVLRHGPKLAVGGLLIALASGFFPLLLGEPPVSHRPGPGEHVVTIGTLELFTPLVLDIGVFLLVVGVLTVLLHHVSRRDHEERP